MAVEEAQRALSLPPADRRPVLEAARTELSAALAASPRLEGAKLTLATIHAWLDEPERALALAPPLDEQRLEERPAWASLANWALARAGRWDELITTAPPQLTLTLANAYRDYLHGPSSKASSVVANATNPAPPCPPLQDPSQAPPEAPTALGPCCLTDVAEACRDCLEAAREAWCQGAAPDLILTATERPAPSPYLDLARSRLRAVAFHSAGRHDDARQALDAAREAALRLPGDPSSSALLLSLDLDRALVFAWLGDTEQSRAILTTTLAASPSEPLLSRALALAAVLSLSGP